jgi:hypothetical protein
MRWPVLWLPVLVACGGKGAGPGSEGGDADTDTDSDSDADADADTDTGPPPVVCTPPIGLADTSAPDRVITDCSTDATLRDALAAGGIITFDCGEATILVTGSTALPIDRDTVLDGGGRVTLDGGDSTRLFTVDGHWWQQTATTVTVQRITVQHFRATPTEAIPELSPNASNCSQGWIDGDGGAVWFRDVHVRIVDAVFLDNAAADVGPDTGGGAVRLLGTSDAFVVGSRFERNRGANGGAVGGLFAGEVVFANNLFRGNEATGYGANGNDPASGCPLLEDGQNQTGSGGNGGATCFDGGDQAAISFCGDVFEDNLAGALGGAFFRTENLGQAPVRFDRVLLERNQSLDRDGAAGGPGGLFLHAQTGAIEASAFVDNESATGCGAIQADSGTLLVSNTTFSGNSAAVGVGGALCDFQGSDVEFSTFAGNRADGGAGFFAGAVFGFGTTLHGCLFADNSGAGGGSQETCNDGIRGSENVQWPEGHAACTADALFTDPALDALGDHGGPTPSFLPASPEVQIGADCPATDQAGAARSEPCTVGSLER